MIGFPIAAVRRWGAGAFPAMQKPATSGTRHQSEARPHVLGSSWKDLSSLVAVTEDTLRTRKPNAHAVSSLSSLSSVENTTTRSASQSDALTGASERVSKWGHVDKFINKVVLAFGEAKLVNARLDPVGKLLFALDKAMQFPCVDGGGRLLVNLAGTPSKVLPRLSTSRVIRSAKSH